MVLGCLSAAWGGYTDDWRLAPIVRGEKGRGYERETRTEFSVYYDYSPTRLTIETG